MIKTKIAVVDDHPIIRFGLRKMLNEMKNVEVVFEACNGKEFVDNIKNIKADLVIIDINMPIMTGDEAVRIVKKIMPDLKIIVLSMNNEDLFFKIMNDLNVDGYIVKESEFDELERAIKTVLKGGKYFSQELLLNMLNKHLVQSLMSLTERETQVLHYLCSGLSTNETAEKLFISPRTVEKHRADLFIKTGTTTSISLVVYAFRNGLVKI